MSGKYYLLTFALRPLAVGSNWSWMNVVVDVPPADYLIKAVKEVGVCVLTNSQEITFDQYESLKGAMG